MVPPVLYAPVHGGDRDRASDIQIAIGDDAGLVPEPGKLVLKTTKSLLQLGAAVGLNENFAGYWPTPTVAPLFMFTDQSRLSLRRTGGKGVVG